MTPTQSRSLVNSGHLTPAQAHALSGSVQKAKRPKIVVATVAADLDRIGVANLEIVICEKSNAAKRKVAVQLAEARWHSKEFLLLEELRLRFYEQVCLPEPPVVDDKERFPCTCIVDRIPGDYNNPDEYDLIEECDNCKEGLTL